MAGDFESDESALRRAIEAAPADDAPWLVYADWLQEHNRDAEATALRQFLPDVQAAVRAGRDVASVMKLVAGQGPVTSRWGLPVAPPARRPYPRREPRASAAAGRLGDPPVPPMAIAFLGSLVLGLLALGIDKGPPRQPADRFGGDARLVKEALAKAREFPKAADNRVAVQRVRSPDDVPPPQAPVSAKPWISDELIGHNFRLEDDRSVLAFTFEADGVARIRQGLKDVFVMSGEGRWWIDGGGDLNVTGSDGRLLFVLTKTKTDGVRYEVTRGGRSEVFRREQAAQ